MYSYKLVRYRDAGMPTYTYFWISDKTCSVSQEQLINSPEQICSPYFESEEEAHAWMNVSSRDE